MHFHTEQACQPPRGSGGYSAGGWAAGGDGDGGDFYGKHKA